ncbi:MAG TPA: type VI secretion system baseplate subunit TssG [Gammaproteobacteria bacterium]|nr:type VI secretion system baseplate subunit TssG [Gammaproteobacteria bacterium]
MAAAARTTAEVVEQLRALEEAPHGYDFFAVLRRLECLYADQPRIGEAARPADEALRLGQKPSLAFAPSALAEFRQSSSGPSYLAAYFFGLFGPNGPLPLHLSEYAHTRELNYDDPAFRRFADIFHHRLLSLFYRAWADAQPVVSLDRPEPRRFDMYVGSLLGLAEAGQAKHGVLADEAKLAFAGRFGLATRPAEGLAGLLEEFFGFDVAVREFVGEWLRLPGRHRLVLGRDTDAAALGGGSVLGEAVWNCGHSFQLVCGPLRLPELKRLLPGQESLDKLRELVRSYVGDEFKWTVRLNLRRDEVPECRLGWGGQLGWTSWLGRRTSPEDADEVVIDPENRGPGAAPPQEQNGLDPSVPRQQGQSAFADRPSSIA